MELIPDSLKRAIAGGIGLLLTLIGLEYAGIVTDAPGVLVKLGNVHNKYTLLALIGLIVTFSLMALEVRGAILIGIVTTTLIGITSSVLGYELLQYEGLSSYERLPAFLTLVVMPFTVSITAGIAMGFISYSILKCVTGRANDVHWGFHVVALVLLTRYVLLPSG